MPDRDENNIKEPTIWAKRRILSLEELGEKRSKFEDYELQDLYLHRWLWSKFKHSLGVIDLTRKKEKKHA